MSDGALFITCEDKGHFFVVTSLVDAALLAKHVWMDGVLDHCRTWRGLREGERWYKYDPADANDLRPFRAEGIEIKRHGRIRGEALGPEAGMWRNVLLLFSHLEPRPEIVVIVRDLDGYPERRRGIEQVLRGYEWPFQVVVATPEPEIEAWLIAGFVPQDERERACLKELRRELSFDPTTESHRLTSHPNDALTDAKRVLRTLCRGDEGRWAPCLADEARLRSRGALNGLTDFLDEVDRRIVPRFGAGR